MGNLQSERIFSEKNGKSSFPTETTMGRRFRTHWASERQMLSSLQQLQGPKATPTSSKRGGAGPNTVSGVRIDPGMALVSLNNLGVSTEWPEKLCALRSSRCVLVLSFLFTSKFFAF